MFAAGDPSPPGKTPMGEYGFVYTEAGERQATGMSEPTTRTPRVYDRRVKFWMRSPSVSTGRDASTRQLLAVDKEDSGMSVLGSEDTRVICLRHDAVIAAHTKAE